MLIVQGKTNWKLLVVVIILTATAVGGFFVWQNEKIVSPVEEMKYCENANDCTPVSCGCKCNGCGGFDYQDVINKKFVEEWYSQQNCLKPTICLQVCCQPTTIGCENNRCVAKRGDANLDEEFNLKFGEVVLIKNENLKIEFLNVFEDSRCPSDVQCIWTGQVKISLSVHKNDQKNLGVYEFTMQAGSPVVQNIEGYAIKLISVNPYPVSTKKIEKSEYSLTLFVSKEEGICKNLCGDGICQEVVCLAIGCPCAETKESCPQDCE